MFALKISFSSVSFSCFMVHCVLLNNVNKYIIIIIIIIIIIKMAKNKCTAKRKCEDERRTFLTKWESLDFFVERSGKPFCLICQASLGQVSNLQRSFGSLNGNINLEFPKGTELRKNKLITLKSETEKKKQFFQKFMKHSETVTLALHQKAWNIARAKKPYNDREFALREGTIALWKSVPMEKYPDVKQAALKILKMFGSTYVCESVFSTLKYVK